MPSTKTLIAFVLCLLACVGVALWLLRPAPPPCVILISIDTLRPDHLGCYGYPRETSPTLDRLASEGALFETVLTSTPWTLPAHAALFTGLPDRVHGCNADDRWLDERRHTLAEAFAAAGYRTAGFFSGPYLHPYFGFGQGFETYEDCTSFLQNEEAMLRGENLFDTVNKLASADVTNPIILRKVRRWLDGNPRQPFFLFLHMWDVHPKFIAPAPYDRMFASAPPTRANGAVGIDDREAVRKYVAGYDGEIRWTDETLKALFAVLRERKLLDRSIIAVTSDHGEAFFEHGTTGHAQSLYEEEVRIPWLLRYPPAIAAGTRVSRVAGIADIAPTLLDLAGLPPLREAMGRSFRPLVCGDERGWIDRPVFCELASTAQHRIAIRMPDWKVMMDYRAGTALVYDLRADPAERSPLDLASFRVPPERLYAIYESTMRALADAGERLPVSGQRDLRVIPPRIAKELRRLGYLR